MYKLLFSLFGWVVYLFSYFFWPILVILIFELFCCDRFSRLKSPVWPSSLSFLSAFFCLEVWGNTHWRFASCFAFFFSFSLFFRHIMLFCLFFGFWPLLQWPIILVCSAVFLVFPCAHALLVVYDTCWGTWVNFTPPQFPFLICDTQVPTSSSLSNNFPPHTLAKIMSCGSVCVSVYLYGYDGVP